MGKVKCKLGDRGQSTHEWNDGEKDRIYCYGWENARGGKIEHDAAVAYGLEIIEEA